ncbi:type I-E CRISPR-associated protein Cse2/CasB [Brachybacterium hainanense]|uniref:Type I-E CRISPR-associated protein Cse2/CasB n=1 Tax=Brachybacterium hainanense TaxID=1541174 RepID=A0ABV6R892_9MICO
MSDHEMPTPSEEGNDAEPTTSSLETAVRRSASRLQEQYLGRRGDRHQAEARGRLAELRRHAGFTPMQRPLALQAVLDSLEPQFVPEDLQYQRNKDEPSPSEKAAFDAMTLFALHMQSARAPMHIPGRSFGTAMGMLRRGSASDSLKLRFDALLASRDERSRLTHARSLITLLRGAGIGFDYGIFARDLRTLSGPHRAGVLLRWGRDVASAPRREREGDLDGAPAAHAS